MGILLVYYPNIAAGAMKCRISLDKSTKNYYSFISCPQYRAHRKMKCFCIETSPVYPLCTERTKGLYMGDARDGEQEIPPAHNDETSPAQRNNAGQIGKKML